MAIDKSNTPGWMKAVLIILALVFVGGFVSVAANPFALLAPQSSGSTPASDTVTAANNQNQPRVSAITAQLQSDPESYTLLTALGNSYFDWASQVQQASQTSSAAVGADAPLWISAKDAYSRALAVKATDPPVLVDYAVTQFYSGDTNGAIESTEKAKKIDPKFAPAYFNQGIFMSALNKNKEAVAAFQQYLKLDPKGQQGNPQYARQQIQQLSGKGTSTP